MKNLCNFLISLREEYLAKRACEKHMLEAKESCQPGGFREFLAGNAFLQNTREIFCLEDF